MNALQKLFVAAAGLLAVIPGIGLFAKGGFSPPGNKLLFGSVVEICGMSALFLTLQYRAKIGRLSNRIVVVTVIPLILFGLATLFMYVFLFSFCDVNVVGVDRIWFPLITTGNLSVMVDRAGSREGTLAPKVGNGAAAVEEAVERTPTWIKGGTTVTFLCLVSMFVASIVVAFLVLGLRNLQNAELAAPPQKKRAKVRTD